MSLSLEDLALVEAAQLFQDQEKEDGVNWKRVAAYLNNEKSSKEYRTLWKNIVLPKLEEPMKPTNAPQLTPQEETVVAAVRLYERHGRGGRIDWNKVAEHINDGRSKSQIYDYWRRSLQPKLGYPSNQQPKERTQKSSKAKRGDKEKSSRVRWTEEEATLLLSSVKQHTTRSGDINWSRVVRQMTRRSYKACYRHWKRLTEREQSQTRRWTPDEDAALREAVQGAGYCWEAVAEHMKGLRTANECQQRWAYLYGDDDQTEHSIVDVSCYEPFTADEETSLLEAVRLFDGQGRNGGVHWKRVAKHLGKQRTSKEYRTYWKQTLRDKTQTSSNMEVDSAREASDSRKRKRSDSQNVESSCSKTPRRESSGVVEIASRKKLSTPDQAMAIAVRQNSIAGQPDWTQIMRQLQDGRNQRELRSHWHEVVQPVVRQAIAQDWTPVEDEELRKCIQQYSGPSERLWSGVSESLGGVRTAFECWQRFRLLNNEAPINGAQQRNISDRSLQRPNSNSLQFTNDEEISLLEAVRLFDGQGRNGGVHWKRVAKHLGKQHTSKEYRTYWKQTLRDKVHNVCKPQEEGMSTSTSRERRLSGETPREELDSLSPSDVLILEAVHQCRSNEADGRIEWKRVAAHVKDGRHGRQLGDYYRKHLLPKINGVTRGEWTPEEDLLLAASVDRHAGTLPNREVSWVKVSEDFGGRRTNVQCKMRWKFCLLPRLRGGQMGPWSNEEDELLRQGVSLYKTAYKGEAVSWVKVSEHMDNRRSPPQCAARWQILCRESETHIESADVTSPTMHEGITAGVDIDLTVTSTQIKTEPDST